MKNQKYKAKSQQNQIVDTENDGQNGAKSELRSLIRREQDLVFASLSKGAKEADTRLSILREMSNKL